MVIGLTPVEWRLFDMRYTLITPTGRVYTFYVLAVAQTYLQAYGGKLFDKSVVQTAEVVL